MDGHHAIAAAALALAVVLQPIPASATESVPETTVVVAKSTFKGPWPLPFGRVTLTCRPSGYANTMDTPRGEFALNDAAIARGVPALKTLRAGDGATVGGEDGLDAFARAADEVCSRRWSHP